MTQDHCSHVATSPSPGYYPPAAPTGSGFEGGYYAQAVPWMSLLKDGSQVWLRNHLGLTTII